MLQHLLRRVRSSTPWSMAAVGTAVAVVLLVAGSGVMASTSTLPDTLGPSGVGSVEDEPTEPSLPEDEPAEPGDSVPTEPVPPPGAAPDQEVDDDADHGVARGTSILPARRSSTIPLGSILLASAVLVAVTVVALVAGSRRRSRRPVPASVPDPVPVQADDQTLDYLLELGRALIDAGDLVDHVGRTLEDIALVSGLPAVKVVVLPTALIVSVPDGDQVDTEVVNAGDAGLRLDQIDQLFALVERSVTGEVGPGAGRAEIARIRAASPPFSPPARVLGHTLFTVGLVLILRGNWLDVLLGGGLGAVIASVQLSLPRIRASYQAFWPLAAAFSVSIVVFGAGRVITDLSVFPPLVAPLVTFLPGALLTTAVLELSTGQIVSGAGRLASGILQLVLLSLGIVAGAQLLGVPALRIGDRAADPVSVIAPWIGVALFGLGVFLYHGARRASLPWILIVLVVAYAGQVLGGAFFGPTLSAFFGAFAMTPVAVLAARSAGGPPALVSFLPAFWLLVPGALGLEGVTRLIDADQVEGVNALVETGTTMIGIALGVLLGLAIGTEVTDRFGRARPRAAPS